MLPAGAAAAAGGHAHAGGRPRQRPRLAQPRRRLRLGGEAAAGAGRAVAHGGGRFVAVPYPAAGRIELVDLLRRSRAGAMRVDGRIGAAAFTRDGARLWVIDEAAGALVGVDPVARR